MLENLHAPGRAHALGDYRILDRDRQPFERANLAIAAQTPIRVLRFARRAVLDQRDDRVEAVIDRLDPLDKSIDHLDRRHVARSQHRNEFVGGSEKQIVRECHEKTPRLAQEIASRPRYCTRSASLPSLTTRATRVEEGSRTASRQRSRYRFCDLLHRGAQPIAIEACDHLFADDYDWPLDQVRLLRHQRQRLLGR